MQTAHLALMFLLLASAAITDVKTYIIHNETNLALFLVSLLGVLIGSTTWVDAVLGFLAIALFYAACIAVELYTLPPETSKERASRYGTGFPLGARSRWRTSWWLSHRRRNRQRGCVILLGGGDLKMLLALSPFVGITFMMSWITGIVLFGGLLGIVYLILHRCLGARFSQSISRKNGFGDHGIPYGVAISAGTMLVALLRT